MKNNLFYDGQNFKAFSLQELSDRGWTIAGTSKATTFQLYQDTCWLGAVINKRAGGVVAIPRLLLKGETEVKENTLPFNFDIAGLMYRASIALDLYAKAYLLQVRNQYKILKVRWLHPESIRLEINEVEGLKYFERIIGAKNFKYAYNEQNEISADGLVWIWELGMAEVGPGIPKADVAKLPAQVLRSIDQHTVKFFDSAAIGQYFFTAANVPQKEERNRFRAWVRRVFFKGISTAYSAEVFGSDLTPHKLGADPSDLEMSELDHQSRIDISAIYDTPEALITGDAGSLSRATLDRITSNWVTGPIMQQAQLIVDSFNHHILLPAGYELTLNAESLSLLQEEERQRARSFSMYVKAGVNPETAAALLGLDIPDGMKLMADKPVILPSAASNQENSGNVEEDESELDESEKENDKAVELARLRSFIKKGTHLKRPFHSDILTPQEIAGEVGKAQDAPFRKQTAIQVGDETIDPELQRYQEEIEELAERARNREIDKRTFENDLKKLVLAAIALAFLLGGGNDRVEGAEEALAEQERIGRESVDKLSAEIFNGEFAESDPDEPGPVRTDAEGQEKLANRLVMWTTAIAGVYALGQVHTPPVENAAGQMVERHYVWRIGGTAEHCSDCLNLDGQVHTAAEWRAAGIEPQSPDLECGGYHCDCRFELTELESIGENF